MRSACAFFPLFFFCCLFPARCAPPRRQVFLHAAPDARQSVVSDSVAHLNAGAALYAQARPKEAAQEYALALRLQPSFKDVQADLDLAQSQADKWQSQVFAAQKRHDSQGADAAFEDQLAALHQAAQDKALLGLRPAFAQARSNLGLLLLNTGRLADAADQERQALALDPTLAEAHLNLGLALSRSGQAEAAKLEWRQALGSPNPAVSAQARTLLAPPPAPSAPPGTADPAGDLDLAQCRRQARQRPNDAGVRNELGLAFYHLSRWDEAAAQFQQALRLSPDMMEAHNNLGLVYDNLGRDDDAMAEYRRALRLAKTEQGPHLNLGVLFYKRGRWDDAASEFHKSIVLSSGPDTVEPGAHLDLGLAFLKLGRWDDAVKEFRTTLYQDPSFAGAQENLGVAEDKQGRHGDALADYRRAVQLDPDRAQALQTLSDTLSENLPATLAVSQFQAVLRSPDMGLAHSLLGGLLLAANQLADAQAEYQAALHMQPDLADAHYGLCRVLLRLGQTDDAERECRAALRLAPTGAARNTLGLLLYEQGHKAEGRAQWTLALT